MISTIFFVGPGVTNAKESEAFNENWAQLIRAHNIEALCCSHSAQEYGLADSTGNATSNISPNFEVAGLGQLVASTLSSERVISFGESAPKECDDAA